MGRLSIVITLVLLGAAEATAATWTNGEHTIAASLPGFTPATQTVVVAAGERKTVTVTLVPVAVALGRLPEGGDTPDTVLSGGATGLAARSHAGRFAGVARVDIDVSGGAAAVVGGSFGVGPAVELTVAAVIGPTMGAYAGASFMIGGGALRPRFSVGVPILFLPQGAGPGGHIAGGVQWSASRAISLSLEVGVQHFPTLDDTVYVRTVFLPSLGLQAWL